jgi:mannose-6-phosphate isomerase-like protein (cupin superfamily)
MIAKGVNQTEYGYDLEWVDNEKFCGKIIVFEKSGKKSDMHFHKERVKSWFVNSGRFKVKWMDGYTDRNIACS